MSGSRLPADVDLVWYYLPSFAGPPEIHPEPWMGPRVDQTRFCGANREQWGGWVCFRVTDWILLAMDGELAPAAPLPSRLAVAGAGYPVGSPRPQVGAHWAQLYAAP
jgi:hypothetical protein